MSYRDKDGHWVYTGLSPFSEEADIASDAVEGVDDKDTDEKA